MPAKDARRREPNKPVIPAGEQTPLVWLNLVCLDAPLVSIAWLRLFGSTFQIPMTPVNGVTLFLTAWLIYLADRLADSRALPAFVIRSLRHEFCLRHQRIWIGALVVIGLADAVLLWIGIDARVAAAGAVVGTFAMLHLLVNYSLGGAWPPLPLKEVTVGLLFASGTLVALGPNLPPIDIPLMLAGFAFAGLCTLNCISIAFWERELDEAQRKVSFATRFPRLERFLSGALILLAACSGIGALVFPQAILLFGCVSLSSLLLALLDRLQKRIGRDQRTALADLVLLTPLLAGLWAN